MVTFFHSNSINDLTDVGHKAPTLSLSVPKHVPDARGRNPYSGHIHEDVPTGLRAICA